MPATLMSPASTVAETVFGVASAYACPLAQASAPDVLTDHGWD
jgi:hypothetical protein